MSKKNIYYHHNTTPGRLSEIFVTLFHREENDLPQPDVTISGVLINQGQPVNSQCYVVCVWNKAVTLYQHFAAQSTQHMQDC